MYFNICFYVFFKFIYDIKLSTYCVNLIKINSCDCISGYVLAQEKRNRMREMEKSIQIVIGRWNEYIYAYKCIRSRVSVATISVAYF